MGAWLLLDGEQRRRLGAAYRDRKEGCVMRNNCARNFHFDIFCWRSRCFSSFPRAQG